MDRYGRAFAQVVGGRTRSSRPVLVTDRVDLHKQFNDTFADYGQIPKVDCRTFEGRANSGTDLKRPIERKDSSVIVVIDKFENAFTDVG